ncbi:ATP-binding protein [Nocardia stercoris]|uniref:ATP-binding protein n=1 Tax=Nocardia stercoris TaxID=2483361 RepID=UPI000EFC5C1B|nr:LuxR C-terminal-related transcriptional regulator [Nocardia stercoris]
MDARAEAPWLDTSIAAAGPDRPLPAGLPQPVTTCIGREPDLAELRATLRTHRIVTLTGAGGAGKSRLGLELARECGAEFAGACWLVELAAVTDPDLIPRAIAAAVGVPEHFERPAADGLAARLGPANALVLLDNCEHLIAATAAVTAELLARCGGLRIVATSRERLGITGEAVHHVRGLSVPDSDDPAVVARADSARLFLARASALQPRLRLTAANARSIGQICRRLDGLPLAIELAAARAGSLGVEQVAARLDDQFALLTQGSRVGLPHHRTLAAAVDWSYHLLTPAERELFENLAVFAGSFAIDDIRAVCAGETDDLLAGLIDKSLVVFDPDNPPNCYRLLETLRGYGQARLRERPDGDRISAAHAAHFRRVAESARAAFHGPAELVWLTRLEATHPNIRAALTWSVEHGDVVTATAIAGAIPHFWGTHGHYREGRQWLARVAAMPGTAGPFLTARALLATGILAIIQTDVPPARDALDRAAAMFGELSDHPLRAHALRYRGLTAMMAGDLTGAADHIRESLHCARAAIAAGQPGGRLAEGWAYLLQVVAALGRQDFPAARAAAEAAEPVLLECGDREGIGWVSLGLAVTAWHGDRLAEGAAHARTCLEVFADLHGMAGLANGLAVAAYLALSGSRAPRSAELLGASEAVREDTGISLLPFGAWWALEPRAKAATVLGAGAFDAHRRTGADAARTDLRGFVGKAIGELAGETAESTPEQTLTPRENQVAELVALGRTNRQIARALGISEKTAEVHVRHIMGKLDARARAEVAAWYAAASTRSK